MCASSLINYDYMVKLYVIGDKLAHYYSKTTSLIKTNVWHLYSSELSSVYGDPIHAKILSY